VRIAECGRGGDDEKKAKQALHVDSPVVLFFLLRNSGDNVSSLRRRIDPGPDRLFEKEPFSAFHDGSLADRGRESLSCRGTRGMGGLATLNEVRKALFRHPAKISPAPARRLHG